MEQIYSDDEMESMMVEDRETLYAMLHANLDRDDERVTALFVEIALRQGHGRLLANLINFTTALLVGITGCTHNDCHHEALRKLYATDDYLIDGCTA